MGKITSEHIKKSYSLGKSYYLKHLSRQDCVNQLVDIGMNENSAKDYLYVYRYFIEGAVYYRTIQNAATEYFLNQIYMEEGIVGLSRALAAVKLHIEYYEGKREIKLDAAREILKKYQDILNQTDNNFFPDEVDIPSESAEKRLKEGAVEQVLVNRYERNPIARKLCLDKFGYRCSVCDFDFEEKYGDLGKEFIHVHHKVDLASIGQEYEVNPLEDLVPVCPNCHAMLHRSRERTLSVEELKDLMK